MKNNIIKVQFDDRGDRLLAFKNKARYGQEIECTRKEWLRILEDEESPCYWSEENKAWTYPGLMSFEEASQGEGDWIKVRTIAIEVKRE